MNEQELREAVKARYGQERPSVLVEEAMDRAYAGLGELPKRKERPVLRALKWAGSTAAGIAAAFLILVGVSAVNPALAASIPGMESIVEFFRGRSPDPAVADGTVNQFVQPVAGLASQAALPEGPAFEITETYYDGEALLFSTRLTLPDAPKEYREVCAQYGENGYQFWADGKQLQIDWEKPFQSRLERVNQNTYVGTVTLYLDEAQSSGALPDTFQFMAAPSALVAVDNKLMVLDEEGSYEEKSYLLDYKPEPFTCTITKTEDLRKAYPVNETKNGCTLKQITATPALTRIDIGVEESAVPNEDGGGVVMQAYDSQGKALESNGAGSFYSQTFRTLDKDETSVTVKFYRSDNKFDALAEFVVPVEGGWYEEPPVTEWTDDNEPIVYDPPLEEPDGSQSGDSTRMVELGETFSVRQGALMSSGSVDATFENLRYYDSWREAGIADEDMNLPGELEQGLTAEEDYTFVLMDLTLEAHGLALFDYDDGGTKGNLWSADFGELTYRDPELRDLTKGEVLAGEGTAYCSEHGNGFTDYYHFFLEGDETKTLQVGYLVKTEELQAGRAVVFGHSDDLSSPVPGLEGEAYWTLFHVLPIPPRP